MRAWAKLGDALDTYKDEGLELIGWFHTHPGHGLFLSPPDKNIHFTQFNKPYHIAMELDSVKREDNARHHFTIFTYGSDQGLNNADNKIGNWFEWDDVQHWLYMSRT